MAGFASGRVTTTVRIENDLYHEVHERLEAEGRGQNAVISLLLARWVAGDITLDSSVNGAETADPSRKTK